MNGDEIKEKILFNNHKIEELSDPSTFVLKPEIQELMEENEQLRKECQHKFVHGVCIYCDALER